MWKLETEPYNRANLQLNLKLCVCCVAATAPCRCPPPSCSSSSIFLPFTFFVLRRPTTRMKMWKLCGWTSANRADGGDSLLERCAIGSARKRGRRRRMTSAGADDPTTLPEEQGEHGFPSGDGGGWSSSSSNFSPSPMVPFVPLLPLPLKLCNLGATAAAQRLWRRQMTPIFSILVKLCGNIPTNPDEDDHFHSLQKFVVGKFWNKNIVKEMYKKKKGSNQAKVWLNGKSSPHQQKIRVRILPS